MQVHLGSGWLSEHGNEPIPKRSKHTVDHEQVTIDKQEFFLETVSEEYHHERVIKFIEATGCDTIKTLVCAICAGHFLNQELRLVKLTDLKGGGRLRTVLPHPAHQLTEGMLALFLYLISLLLSSLFLFLFFITQPWAVQPVLCQVWG